MTRPGRWARAALVSLGAAAALLPVARAEPVPPVVPIVSGPLTATVTLDPFTLTVRQAGRTVLRTSELAFAVDPRLEVQTPLVSYGVLARVPVPRFTTTHATAVGSGRFMVHTDDPAGRRFDLTIRPTAAGVLEIDAVVRGGALVSAAGAVFAGGPDERFLGFGERSDGVDQTGRVVETWAEEGPFSAGAARPLTDPLFGEDWQGPAPVNRSTNYPVPWFVSSRGYGFLLDSSALSRFDVRRPQEWHVEVREPRLRMRVVGGPRPADVVQRYTALVGRQPEPADWFFGPWYQPAGSDAQRAALRDDWRRWDIPVTVAQTYTHYLPCGAHLSNRSARRDDVAAYHERGYRVTTYVNSFVCQNHPGGAYEVGDRNRWFVRTPLGTTYPIPYAAYLDTLWSAVVDFTSADATRWWQQLVTEALDDGYDGWMEDFGEYVPPDALAADGRTGHQLHNDYCDLYHAASHALTWPRRGRDFAQFVRCGSTDTARSARIVWGGDPTEDDSEADGLAAAVSQGLSMGLSGVAYWGSDIGGFHALFTSGRTSPELLARWVEAGAFEGIMRTQADGYPRPGIDEARPQVWDPAIRPVWRRYAKLRTQLFPYIAAAAAEYQRTGMPIMRHLALQWPDAPEVYAPQSAFSYLFGPDLLVAPVVDEGATRRTLWLPPGEWVDFWSATTYDEHTGELRTDRPRTVVAGNRVVTVDAPIGRIPLFVRAGACIPVLPPDVDTLSDLADPSDVVTLADAAGRHRVLAYGDACPAT